MKIFLSLLEERRGVATTKSVTEFVLNFLKIRNNLSIITLNLQIYFTATYKGRRKRLFFICFVICNYFLANLYLYYIKFLVCILKKRSEDIEQSIKPLLNNIHRIQTIKSREDLDQLYHLISCYAMLISGLGDPSDSEMLKEVVGMLCFLIIINCCLCDMLFSENSTTRLRKIPYQCIKLFCSNICVFILFLYYFLNLYMYIQTYNICIKPLCTCIL